MFGHREMAMKYVGALKSRNSWQNHMMNNSLVIDAYSALSLSSLSSTEVDFETRVYRDHCESVHCLGNQTEQQLTVDFLSVRHGYRA